jgi:sulfur relay (sulfurtransferase) complex TusBCD TusD component (DsrE family)
MKTTTYICDICKKSVGEAELVTVEISAKMMKMPNGYMQQQRVSKDICKDCLKGRGIVTEYVPGENDLEEITKANNKTLESKLVDILEDLGVQFQE